MCIQLRRPAIDPDRFLRDAEEERRVHEAGMRDRLERQEFNVVGGIDLGERYFLAANFMDMRTGCESNVKVRSVHFRWMCGEFNLKRNINAEIKARESPVLLKEADRANFALNPFLRASSGYRLMHDELLDQEILDRQVARNDRRLERIQARADARAAAGLPPEPAPPPQGRS